MIRGPQPQEEKWCRDFFGEHNITLTDSAHFLLFQAENGRPSWVVGFDDWVGKTCHLYVVANGKSPVPRDLARVTFHYAFEIINRKVLFAVCNSLNTRVMKLVGWLGFQEVYRGRQLHEGGGDIVFFHMTQERWKAKVRNGKEKSSAIT